MKKKVKISIEKSKSSIDLLSKNEKKEVLTKNYSLNELQKLNNILEVVSNRNKDFHMGWGNHTEYTKGW